jgi:hypothetical protein
MGMPLDVPPDMTEFLKEEAQEPEHKDTLGKVEELKPTESDKTSCEEFMPVVEPTSKAAHKIAQENPTTPTAPATKPFDPTQTQEIQVPSKPVTQRPVESKLAQDIEGAGGKLNVMAHGGIVYNLVKDGDKYQINTVTTKIDKLTTVDNNGLVDFERQLGKYSIFPIQMTAEHIVAMIKQASKDVDTLSWREYWFDVGMRVAQKKPRVLTPEQKEKRRQHRRQRRLDLKGLPAGLPGTRPPPMPKVSQEVLDGKKDVDEVACLKEKVRLYDQLVDELEFVLEDQSLREDETMLVNEVEEAIDSFVEQMEEMDEGKAEEQEDKLDLSTPPVDEPTIPTVARKVVRMADLRK